MYLMTDDVVLDVRKMDDDMEVRLQVERFECVPDTRHTHGYAVAVTRNFPDEPTLLHETVVFEPGDVFKVGLSTCRRICERNWNKCY